MLRNHRHYVIYTIQRTEVTSANQTFQTKTIHLDEQKSIHQVPYLPIQLAVLPSLHWAEVPFRYMVGVPSLHTVEESIHLAEDPFHHKEKVHSPHLAEDPFHHKEEVHS